MVPHFFKSVIRFKSCMWKEKSNFDPLVADSGAMGNMKLGVSIKGTVLNECAKFHKKLSKGSRGCHRLPWHKNNKKAINNNRFPPHGAATGSLWSELNTVQYSTANGCETTVSKFTFSPNSNCNLTVCLKQD